MMSAEGGRPGFSRAPRHIVNSPDHHEPGFDPKASLLARTPWLRRWDLEQAWRGCRPVGFDPLLTEVLRRGSGVDPVEVESAGLARTAPALCQSALLAEIGRRIVLRAHAPTGELCGIVLTPDLRRFEVFGDVGVLMNRPAWSCSRGKGWVQEAVVTTSLAGFLSWAHSELSVFGVMEPSTAGALARLGVGWFSVRESPGGESISRALLAAIGPEAVEIFLEVDHAA